MNEIQRFWIRVVNYGFYLLYHQMAWTYDLVSWLVSFGNWRAWQKAALPFIRGTEILEIAHGPGHMLVALSQCGFRAAGLDLSPQMNRIAQRRVKEAQVSVPVIRARAEQLPFSAAVYDTVLATFPTQFIVEQATLYAVQRILKPGGVMLIVPQAELTGSGLLTRFVEGLYAITGQRRHQDPGGADYFGNYFAESFSMAGFILETKKIEMENSEVTVLIAEKPG